ncbi:hypothetical protein UA24_20155, partial [Marinomonas sp. BSi20414]|nr:hypothetical protein [Marinomonas sp. BSi20414]
PKDLVAHARSQGYASLFPMSTPKHYIAFPNEVAPVEGVWQCNLTDEEVSLKKGERLPSKTENENEHKLFWVSE